MRVDQEALAGIVDGLVIAREMDLADAVQRERIDADLVRSFA